MQWEVSTDGGSTFTAISGATSPTYSFTPDSTYNNNQYEAVFTNSAGSVTSNAVCADGRLCADPDHQPGQPNSQRGRHGDLYGGGQRQSGRHGAVVFQHRRRNVRADLRATSNTYTTTAASAENGTQYQAVLTNNIGTPATTPAATLNVEAANGLTVIAPPPAIAVGSPVLVAVNSTNTNPDFQVQTSSSSDPTGSDLTVTFMPDSNPVLRIITNLGEMDFQLLENYTPNTVNQIESLIGRALCGQSLFVLPRHPGFHGTGRRRPELLGTPVNTIPVELNPNLRFTSSGLLAMANDGVDGNSSEFFITDPSVDNVTNAGVTASADMATSSTSATRSSAS